MVKSILENCIAQVENYRQQQIAATRQRVMQEKIIPYNKEIDQSCREAVAELAKKHDEKIAQLHQLFEQEKRTLFQAAEEQKSKFSEQTIAEAVAFVEYNANETIKKVNQIISEQEG